MKTVPLSKCSRLAMVNGGEKSHPQIVHNGDLKEWVGFGWIVIRKATRRDTKLYPTAI